jgi:predicted SprT family Zn-dependent metalloprotease
MIPRYKTVISADFPGAACPPESHVRFPSAEGWIEGAVTELRLRHAVVAAMDGTRWRVPYGAVTVIERARAAEFTLREVEDRAQKLLERHRRVGGLDAGWTFGFDLAPVRAGICRYARKRIELSVSYCLRATRTQIEDTLLHEIAHAIVGQGHHHDTVWQAKAREIGCSGERCHDVTHSVPQWVGRCGCGQRWYRRRLHRRMWKNALCARCGLRIEWRRNRESVPAEVRSRLPSPEPAP